MKMQEIIKQIENARKEERLFSAIDEIVEALKLLAKGEERLMGDVERLQRDSNPRIGE